MQTVINNPAHIHWIHYRKAAMTIRQLQIQAREEWSRSPDIKGRYHTFEYYWAERYERIYRFAIGFRLWWKLTY